MSQQNINGYTTEQTNLSNDDWFDIDAYLGVDDYESRKVSFGTMKAKILSEASNIYNSNGTLTGNRTIDADGNSIDFFNVIDFSILDSSNRGLSKYEIGGLKYFILSGIYANLQMHQNINKPYDISIDAIIANNRKGATYFQDYSSGWDNTTPSEILTTLGFVTANGTTANRPTQGIVGQQYLDTDINKLIVWNGTNWIDAMGTIV